MKLSIGSIEVMFGGIGKADTAGFKFNIGLESSSQYTQASEESETENSFSYIVGRNNAAA